MSNSFKPFWLHLMRAIWGVLVFFATVATITGYTAKDLAKPQHLTNLKSLFFICTELLLYPVPLWSLLLIFMLVIGFYLFNTRTKKDHSVSEGLTGKPSMQQGVTAPKQRPQQPGKPEPDGDDGDPAPPWPLPPPGERKPVWFRSRVYRYVRFGGSNSRIETLDGKPDPLGELQEQDGTTGTIQNSRLFNDRQGQRQITSADHP